MVPISKDYLNGSKKVLIPSYPISIACLALKYHVQLFPHLCSIHSDLENYLQFPKCTCCFTSLLLYLFFPYVNSQCIPQTALLPSGWKKACEVFNVLKCPVFIQPFVKAPTHSQPVACSHLIVRVIHNSRWIVIDFSFLLNKLMSSLIIEIIFLILVSPGLPCSKSPISEGLFQ